MKLSFTTSKLTAGEDTCSILVWVSGPSDKLPATYSKLVSTAIEYRPALVVSYASETSKIDDTVCQGLTRKY